MDRCTQQTNKKLNLNPMKKTTLKNLTACFLFSISGITAYAQNGLECIVVEKYYVSNAADAAGSLGVLPSGSVTYRVYADMLPGYKFQALYGVTGHPMNIQTTTLFFNNEDRGATTSTYTKAQATGNTIMLDSWFSVGGACSNQLGIMKSEDNGVANVVNADGILQNNDASAGIPLTTQDGLIAGTPVSVTFVGLSASDLNVFDALSNVGNSFATSNGSVAALGGSMGPIPATNEVLVGQFTTDGAFSFALNVQIGTPSGGVENYVAQSPTGSEIMLSCLTYNSLTVDVKNDPKPAGPSVKIYPNPVSDVVKLDIASSDKIEKASYKIINVLGATIADKTIGQVMGNYSETVDISSLSRGIYFMELNLDGTKTTTKLIKK
jgi:hypothetical protein